MKKLSIILLTASLAACGGGGSDSAEDKPEAQPTDVVPIGLWEGQLTSKSDGSSIAVAVLIAPDGEVKLIRDDGEQGTGVLVFKDGLISGVYRIFNAGGYRINNSSVSGEYTPTSITGKSYLGVYEPIIISDETLSDETKLTTFSFSISEQSANGASLATIIGNYATEDAETSIAIDVDGLISGSDTDGCQYSGKLTVPDASVNVYDMALTVSSCGLFNGEYNGLASYAKPFTDSPEIGLVFQVDNGTYSVTDIIIK